MLWKTNILEFYRCISKLEWTCHVYCCLESEMKLIILYYDDHASHRIICINWRWSNGGLPIFDATSIAFEKVYKLIDRNTSEEKMQACTNNFRGDELPFMCYALINGHKVSDLIITWCFGYQSQFTPYSHHQCQIFSKTIFPDNYCSAV